MPGFLKVYADHMAAAEARRRSAALRAAGVPTPAARPGPSPHEVLYSPIAGASGAALTDADLAAMLTVLARLHRAPLPGLPPHDPFRRILPRLGIETRVPVRAVLAEPLPQGRSTLHGDLHAGQFIREPNGQTWIVDLDDLALGAPEADLANLAAHFATRGPVAEIETWSVRVRSAWTRLGHRLDDRALAGFLCCALVRRHLKLREAGRPDFEAQIIAYLRDNSNFSIR